MTPSQPAHSTGVCPDCGTELTRCRGHRGGDYSWCWKCEREVGRDLMAALENSLKDARS